MAEIIISSYFQDGSGPVTGLTPTLRIWEVSDSGELLVVGTPCGTGSVTDGVMLELADCGSPETEQDGFYRYTFNDGLGYDTTKSYVVRVDGGVSLAAGFRYQVEKISCTDSKEGIASSVWNATASDYAAGSPETMGVLQNNTYNSVEIIRTNDIPALYDLMDLIRKYHTNRTKIDGPSNTLTIYEDDCVTPLRVFRLKDSTGTPSVAEVCERTGTNGIGSPLVGPDGYPTCD